MIYVKTLNMHNISNMSIAFIGQTMPSCIHSVPVFMHNMPSYRGNIWSCIFQWPQGNFNEETTLDITSPNLLLHTLGNCVYSVCTTLISDAIPKSHWVPIVNTYDGGKFPCGLIQMLSMQYACCTCVSCVHTCCACMMIYCTYMKCRASLVPRPPLQLSRRLWQRD